MSLKKQPPITYQFKELEQGTTSEEADIFLQEMIDEWEKLGKRFSLQDSDRTTVYQCMFYAGEIIRKFPDLKLKYLYHHYDEAMDEFLGRPYEVRRDKKTQELLGYRGVIMDGKMQYLFPLEK